MHPIVYRTFEEICSQAAISGPVLEVGAVPGPDCLLRLPCLKQATPKVGLNLSDGGPCGDYDIIAGNANQMNNFADGQFATVLCNATLEHDRYFWKTIAEIHRVTSSGGFIAIGVPGFAGMGLDRLLPRTSLLGLLLRLFARGPNSDLVRSSTVTLGVHNFPGDYYRFTEQAAREVFMDGLTGVAVRTVMNPPRIIAYGRKP